MYYNRIFRLLVVTLSVTSVAQASLVHHGRIPDGAIVKRQETGVSANDDPTTTPPPPATSLTPTSTPPSDDGNDKDSTTSSPPPAKTDPTTSQPTPTKSTTSDDSKPKPSDSPDPTQQQPTTETFVHVITTTNSDGQPTAITSSGTVTKTPGLSQGSSGGTSGMTKETRNIVIGVVVGVGGAIVLGALGFVAWRIWGRKKQAEEQDNLMSYGDKADDGSSPGGTVGHARNPFQSTLETYHAPTQVNASSNF